MHHAVALSSVSSCEVEAAAWLHKECERALQCVQPCMAVSKIKKNAVFMGKEGNKRKASSHRQTHTHTQRTRALI